MTDAAAHPRSLLGRARRVRALLPILVRREIRTRYRTSVLDLLWTVITPVAIMAVYGFILTRSFKVTGSCAPYLTSAWTGLVLWTVFATAVGSAVYSLVASSDLITKVYFPLEAMPLANTGAALVDLVVGVVTMVVLALAQGVTIRPVAVLAVLSVGLLVLWAAVLAMIAAVLAVFIRDAIHAVNLAIRVGFFLTPVMYESALLPESIAWTAHVNPVAVAIDGVRAALLCGRSPNLVVLAGHYAIALAAFVLSVAYIRSVESRAVDVV